MYDVYFHDIPPTQFPSRFNVSNGGDGETPSRLLDPDILPPSLDQFLSSFHFPSLGYSFSLFSAADRDWSTCLSSSRGDSLRANEMAANKTMPVYLSAWKRGNEIYINFYAPPSSLLLFLPLRSSITISLISRLIPTRRAFIPSPSS